MRTMKNDKEGVTYSRWDPTYPLDMRGRTHPILVWQYSDAASANGKNLGAMSPHLCTNFWYLVAIQINAG